MNGLSVSVVLLLAATTAMVRTNIFAQFSLFFTTFFLLQAGLDMDPYAWPHGPFYEFIHNTDCSCSSTAGDDGFTACMLQQTQHLSNLRPPMHPPVGMVLNTTLVDLLKCDTCHLRYMHPCFPFIFLSNYRMYSPCRQCVNVPTNVFPTASIHFYTWQRTFH
jgi:hypothetical protein